MFKKFLTYTILSILSILTSFFLAICIIIGIISGMVPQKKSPIIGPNAVLELNISGFLPERGTPNPLSYFIGSDLSSVGLDQYLQALQEAEHNPQIKALFLKGGLLQADPATQEELRKAILNFKKSKKPIIAYADIYSQGSYYICSAADKIYLNTTGQLDWHGLSAEPIFFKETLEKLGIKMQVFKKGTYKSAVEPFTSTQMSEANREQINSYVQSIWNKIVSDVSESRKISKDSLQTYADRLMTFAPASQLLQYKLIDKLVYIDDMRSTLKKVIGIKETDHIQLLSPEEIVTNTTEDKKQGKAHIAVYYACGDIVSHSVENIYSGDIISANTVIKDLDQLKKDNQVKAVVLRINSGGGSAYASEQIWHAVRTLNQVKPVIVSMGGTTASGAYYLSCGADYLIAEPTTLTGSIGIFGMFPDASQLLTEKLSIHYDRVKTNRHADFGSISRPMNSEEQQIIQQFIERGYDLFIERVQTGRHMDRQQVEKLAEGRVWTGEQALKNGLVDSLGSLNDAIRIAAQKVGITDFRTVYYPLPQPWYKTLAGELQENFFEDKIKAHANPYYPLIQLLESVWQQDPIQARIPYVPNIN